MKSYKRINFEERVKIETFLKVGWTLTAIGKEFGRPTCTISREITRFPYTYTAAKANVEAIRKSKKHHTVRKLTENSRLYNVVIRFLKKRWSPNQISAYLKKQYASDISMQISNESIYTFIYVLPKGELKKELIGYLRQKKKKPV